MSLAISNEVIKTLALESIYENVKNFNSKSGGAISLNTNRHKGDFLEEHFLKFTQMVGYRDPYSTASANFASINSEKQVSPKIGYKAKVEIMQSEINRYGGNSQIVLAKISRAIGLQITKQMLDSALVCASASIGSNEDVVVDSCQDLDFKLLLQGLSKFGDYAENIKTFVMHSGSLFGLLNEGLNINSDTVINGVVYNSTPASLNRRIYSVDNSHLLGTKDCDGNETNIYKILALQTGGIQVIESEESDYLVEKDGRGENIVYRISAEGSFDVKVAGYSYTGGSTAIKDDTKISKTTNWQKVVTDDKATAGSMIIHK